MRDRSDWFLGYNYKRFKLQVESLAQSSDKTGGGQKESDGWYLLGVYDLVKKEFPKLQLVAKYEEYEPDDDVVDDEEAITTLGINYFFNKYVKIMCDYRFKNEEVEIANDEFLTQLQVKF